MGDAQARVGVQKEQFGNLGDRDVRPDRCWRKMILVAEETGKTGHGTQPEHRTRARDLRNMRNHANPSRFD
jgi:hypothetical protein